MVAACRDLQPTDAAYEYHTALQTSDALFDLMESHPTQFPANYIHLTVTLIHLFLSISILFSFHFCTCQLSLILEWPQQGKAVATREHLLDGIAHLHTHVQTNRKQ